MLREEIEHVKAIAREIAQEEIAIAAKAPKAKEPVVVKAAAKAPAAKPAIPKPVAGGNVATPTKTVVQKTVRKH